jgi:hypothetical protein
MIIFLIKTIGYRAAAVITAATTIFEELDFEVAADNTCGA